MDMSRVRIARHHAVNRELEELGRQLVARNIEYVEQGSLSRNGTETEKERARDQLVRIRQELDTNRQRQQILRNELVDYKLLRPLDENHVDWQKLYQQSLEHPRTARRDEN